MKKLIIFDLDGTLLNTLEDLTDCVNFALSNSNYPLKTIDEVRNFIGNGVEKLIERSLPNEKNDKNFSVCLEIFKKHYLKNMFNKTKPYKGIIDLLNELKNKNYKIAVLSNKFDSAVKMICNKYFPNMIDYSQGTSNEIPKKPSINGVKKILNHFELENNVTIFVGDSEVDITTANNAGIPCISVSWGYKTEEFLKHNNATSIAKTPEELLTLINNL